MKMIENVSWRIIEEAFCLRRGIQKVCPQREAVSKKVTGKKNTAVKRLIEEVKQPLFLKPQKEKKKDVQVISKSFGKRCANQFGRTYTNDTYKLTKKKKEKTVMLATLMHR